MAQAGESDGKVIQRLNDSESAFAALNPDSAASQLPRLQVSYVVAILQLLGYGTHRTSATCPRSIALPMTLARKQPFADVRPKVSLKCMLSVTQSNQPAQSAVASQCSWSLGVRSISAAAARTSATLSQWHISYQVRLFCVCVPRRHWCPPALLTPLLL